MKKFHSLYKEKQRKSNLVQEKRILDDFKRIYGALLEKYDVDAYENLNKRYQRVFLTEIHNYWSEEDGLSKKGTKFLGGMSDMLNEDSTTVQKKNYIQKRIDPIMRETLRQSELKWKVYEVINEVYEGVNGKKLSDVLTPRVMMDIIKESAVDAMKGFLKEMNTELIESGKTPK